MKRIHRVGIPRAASILLALSILGTGIGSVAAGEIDGLSGPYFGQIPPEFEAEIFAPDLVSLEGRYEFAISFAPGANGFCSRHRLPRGRCTCCTLE